MFIIIIKDQKLKKKKKKKKIENVEIARFCGSHGFWAKIVSLHFHLIFFPLIHGDI